MNLTDTKLSERVFNFEVDIQKLLFSLEKYNLHKDILSALSESSIYLGKVYEDTHKIESTSDFIWKIGIILSNIEICNHNLRILSNIIPNENNNEELKRLLKETEELKTIFTSIKETNEKKQKDESKSVIIPHIGKISFISILIFSYFFVNNKNPFYFICNIHFCDSVCRSDK